MASMPVGQGDGLGFGLGSGLGLTVVAGFTGTGALPEKS